MTKFTNIPRATVGAVSAILCWLCGQGYSNAHAGGKADSATLIVFAAASLKTALDGIAADYQEATSAKVSISYAASSALAKQIEHGAPADLFASADRDWMDYVSSKGLIDTSSRTNLLSNRIVLIAPSASTSVLKIGQGFDLAGASADSKIAMADPAAVPAGKYGRAALETLGVWTAVQDKIASVENARAALALVARREAAFGIVFQSDAQAEPRVKILDTFGASTHPPIVYPFAVTATAKSNAAAHAFLAYLATPTAKSRFAAQGFTIASSASATTDARRGQNPNGDWSAITLSLRIALTATLLTLPFAIAFAYLLARCQFPGKSLLDGVLHLPLVLPPVVTGYVLLLAFGKTGPAGAFLSETFGISLSFRWTGAALACAVMGFPLMLRAIRLSFESVDQRLEAAAGTLGANRLWTFLLITLPLALPGVLAGAILCFAKALGEFGATITFVSSIPGETRTISSAIYGYTQVPGGDAAAIRLMVISTAIALVAMIASEALNRRMQRRIAVFAS